MAPIQCSFQMCVSLKVLAASGYRTRSTVNSSAPVLFTDFGLNMAKPCCSTATSMDELPFGNLDRRSSFRWTDFNSSPAHLLRGNGAFSTGPNLSSRPQVPNEGSRFHELSSTEIPIYHLRSIFRSSNPAPWDKSKKSQLRGHHATAICPNSRGRRFGPFRSARSTWLDGSKQRSSEAPRWRPCRRWAAVPGVGSEGSEVGRLRTGKAPPKSRWEKGN